MLPASLIYNHTMPQRDRTWTSRRLLAWTSSFFESKKIDRPRLAAEMLLGHVLGVPRLKLYMDPDRPASDAERTAFRALVEQAADDAPVDYLVGQAPFFAMVLKVNPSVLIPRPSTETLVEHVIQHARRTPGFDQPLIADIGTGSGAIAIALAKHMPASRVIATDLSSEALEVAKCNAVEQGVAERIDFVQGNLLEPLAGQKVRYLLSNPPYISDDEWQDVAAGVKDHEPTMALRAGPDGLEYLRPIIAQAPTYLDDPGQLVLEGAAAQERMLVQLACEAGLPDAHILADHEALPRVLVAQRDEV
jgi:release factor glutamine methyltransferase